MFLFKILFRCIPDIALDHINAIDDSTRNHSPDTFPDNTGTNPDIQYARPLQIFHSLSCIEGNQPRDLRR